MKAQYATPMFKKIHASLIVLTVSGFAILSTCGKDSPTKPEPPATPQSVTPAATRIEISPSSATLTSLGRTVQLTAKVVDQNNNTMTGAAVIWTSTDTGVVTVTVQGLVTAVKNGVVRITARSGSASASVDVKVMQAAGRIVIAPEAATLMSIGETVQLTARVLDQNGQPVADALVTWASSDEAVATVSAQGLVTAVSNGVARITASITESSRSVSNSIEVTVSMGNTREQEEREVLIAFYNSLDGPNWKVNTNWLSDLPLDKWYGISTDDLGNVTRIELDDNRLGGAIQSDIALGKLENLRVVSLWGNELTSVPEGLFSGLDNLRIINLAENELTSVPDGLFSGLDNLRGIELASNELTSVPDGLFSGLGKLNYIRLAGNKLTSVPEGLFAGLRELRQLALSYNNLESVPAGLFTGLHNLDFMNLFGSTSEESRIPLPARLFAGLVNLRELHLGDSGWESIPENLFFDLTNLRILNLNGCADVQTFPVGVLSRLTNLSELHLNNNGIVSLPKGMFNGLTNLSELDLRSNPGTPFELTMELHRTDSNDPLTSSPASVEAMLESGAPFTINSIVSVVNGTLSESSVIIAGGSDTSESITVYQNPENTQAPTYVELRPVTMVPLGFQGVVLGEPDPLLLFNDSDNRGPYVSEIIPHHLLQVGGPRPELDLSSHFRDPDGDELSFTVTFHTGDQNVVDVSVDDETRTLNLAPQQPGFSSWTVTAADQIGLTARQRLEVTVLDVPDGASFDIDLVFLDRGTPEKEELIRSAASRWEDIIVNDLPDVPIVDADTFRGQLPVRVFIDTVDDLVVFTSFDVNEWARGHAEILGVRDVSYLPYSSRMSFHPFADVEAGVHFLRTALHEIGHTLGFGTVWHLHGLIEKPSWNDVGADTHFSGTQAIAAFDLAGGTNYMEGAKVPVENTRAGSQDSHWRASVLRGEVMNPSGGNDYPQPEGGYDVNIGGYLSAITVQSLADLGYEVDVSGADEYHLPGYADQPEDAMSTQRVSYSFGLDLNYDVIRGTIIVVDEAGNVVHVVRNR